MYSFTFNEKFMPYAKLLCGWRMKSVLKVVVRRVTTMHYKVVYSKAVREVIENSSLNFRTYAVWLLTGVGAVPGKLQEWVAR